MKDKESLETNKKDMDKKLMIETQLKIQVTMETFFVVSHKNVHC